MDGFNDSENLELLKKLKNISDQNAPEYIKKMEDAINLISEDDK